MMNQSDVHADTVSNILGLAIWETFSQAVACAYLERALNPGNDYSIGIYATTSNRYTTRWHDPDLGSYWWGQSFKLVAVVDTDPAYKPAPKPEPKSEPDTPSRIESELAELRHDIDDLSRRVKVLNRDHVGQIKPEQQPQ